MASINANTDDMTLRWSCIRLNVGILHTDLAREVVHFHIEHLAWHHNVLHCSTFLKQCELYWETEMVVDVFWLALYISVMNVSCFQVGEN